jgi:hypothetical protein
MGSVVMDVSMSIDGADRPVRLALLPRAPAPDIARKEFQAASMQNRAR